MSEILKLLMYIVEHHGYWAAIFFVIVSIIPLLAAVYIVFSRSSLGKVIDEKFTARIQEEKETHKHGNRLRKEFTRNVQEILQDLAEHTHADRTLVFEFSNGTSNLVGLPFLFMSAAAEVVTPNTTLVGQTYQRMNISMAANFLMKLEETGFVYVEDLNNASEEFRVLSYFMLPNDAKSALFCSIQGIDEAIGFLVITTLSRSENTINVCTALPLMRKAVQKVGALLNFNAIKQDLDEEAKKKKFKWPWME